MSDKRTAIMDVAETLIRAHGYAGFSFRDVADQVGIRSASVHYHFPTKPDLAAAVAKRYRARFSNALEELEHKGIPRVEAWRSLFRMALQEDGLMCLCGILAAEGNGLPAQVCDEARAFMTFGIDTLNEVHAGHGAKILSQLEGAMLIARSTGNLDVFDQATHDLGSTHSIDVR